MALSLGDVLAMEVCRRGRPVVVAGADRLDSPVRWVHAMELTDVARLLRGGELVLSTGIALPDDDRLLAAYVAELAEVGVAGLAVELGRRYAGSLPGALVAAAARTGLPLIAFEREVAFVEITEAVHARIIDAQLDDLRVSERLHEMFTELSVAGASAEEVVGQAAALAGRPVILADLSHRVLAFSPGGADPGRLLSGFAARSRSVVSRGRTVFDEASGWLVTPGAARRTDPGGAAGGEPDRQLQPGRWFQGHLGADLLARLGRRSRRAVGVSCAGGRRRPARRRSSPGPAAAVRGPGC